MNAYFLVSLLDTPLAAAQSIFRGVDLPVVRAWELPAYERDYLVVGAPETERVVEVLGASPERDPFGIQRISGIVVPDGIQAISVGDAFRRKLIPLDAPAGLPVVAPENALPRTLVWCDVCRSFQPSGHRH